MTILFGIAIGCLSLIGLVVIIIAALETNRHRKQLLKEVLSEGINFQYSDIETSPKVSPKKLLDLSRQLVEPNATVQYLSFNGEDAPGLAFLHIHALHNGETKRYDFQLDVEDRAWYRDKYGKFINELVPVEESVACILNAITENFSISNTKYSVEF